MSKVQTSPQINMTGSVWNTTVSSTTTTYSYGAINRLDELEYKKRNLIHLGNWYYGETETVLDEDSLNKYLRNYERVSKEIEDLIVLRSR